MLLQGLAEEMIDYFVMRRLPYQLIWGFRCSWLTTFHFLLETASSIFISLLIHLFLLFLTIRDYSQQLSGFQNYSSLFATIPSSYSGFITVRDYSPLFVTSRHYSPLIRVLLLAILFPAECTGQKYYQVHLILSNTGSFLFSF